MSHLPISVTAAPRAQINARRAGPNLVVISVDDLRVRLTNDQADRLARSVLAPEKGKNDARPETRRR